MRAHPSLEELEALSLGERPAEVEAHVAGCAECSRELAWLEAERALISRRPKSEVAHLWAGVATRLEQPGQPLSADQRKRPRPHWARRLVVAAAAAASAAAVLLLTMHPKGGPNFSTPDASVAETDFDRPDPKTLAALDRAEGDYRHAATVLEAEYAAARKELDPKLVKQWDESLAKARAQLGASRAVAAEDVNARMRVLDGYAGYVRLLRNVMEAEEANP